MPLIISCMWLTVVAWLISRAVSQRGLLPLLQAAELAANETAPHIAVIVPARDEQDNIEICLRGLLDQTYPAARMRILVIDDHSADATVSLVAAIAERHSRVRLLSSPPLPPRWIGKSHACWVASRAVPKETGWLCFIDADVRAGPKLLASAIATVASDKLDLLTLSPRQEFGSFAERLVMPCGFYLLAFYQDLRKAQSPGGDDVIATGQFMLIRRSTYETVGGHAAICSSICEDVALARLLKRNGYNVIMQDGSRTLSTRMYTGWRTLWPGVAKNLVDMLGGPAAATTVSIAAIVLAWAALLVPLACAYACARGSSIACLAFAPALAGSAAAFGLHIAGTSFFGIPFWYGLLFPLGYSVGAVMALDSVRRRLCGRVSWKGRTYP